MALRGVIGSDVPQDAGRTGSRSANADAADGRRLADLPPRDQPRSPAVCPASGHSLRITEESLPPCHTLHVAGILLVRNLEPEILGMKVLIQNTDNQKFLSRRGSWDDTVSNARDFQTPVDAIRFATETRLGDFRVVLQFPEPDGSPGRLLGAKPPAASLAGRS